MYDSQGTELADTATARESAEPVAGDPLRLRAAALRRRDGVAAGERDDAFAATVVGEPTRLTLVITKRLTDSRAAAGVMRAALPLAAAAGLAVAVLLALLLSASMMRRLHHLRTDAEALGASGLEHPVAVTGADEVTAIDASSPLAAFGSLVPCCHLVGSGHGDGMAQPRRPERFGIRAQMAQAAHHAGAQQQGEKDRDGQPGRCRRRHGRAHDRGGGTAVGQSLGDDQRQAVGLTHDGRRERVVSVPAGEHAVAAAQRHRSQPRGITGHGIRRLARGRGVGQLRSRVSYTAMRPPARRCRRSTSCCRRGAPGRASRLGRSLRAGRIVRASPRSSTSRSLSIRCSNGSTTTSAAAPSVAMLVATSASNIRPRSPVNGSRRPGFIGPFDSRRPGR